MIALENVKSVLGISEEQILRFVREGRLRAFQQGPGLMFSADDVSRMRNELNAAVGASNVEDVSSVERSAHPPAAGERPFLTSGLLDLTHETDDVSLAASLDDLIPTGRTGARSRQPKEAAVTALPDAFNHRVEDAGHADDASTHGTWLRTIAGKIQHGLGRVKTDTVQCTVFAPATVYLGEPFLVQAFAHLAEEAKGVKASAQRSDPETTSRGSVELTAPVRRGSRVDFRLALPGLTLDGAAHAIVWWGSVVEVRFAASMPESFAQDALSGAITISEESVQIGQIKFS